MIPFYQSPESQSAFIAESRSWLGTPFRENAAIKGAEGGVDCVRFASAVHTACGACEGIVLETLPVEWVRRWHEHHAESRLVDFFNQPSVRARLKKIEDGPRMVGDLVALRFDRCVHHVALWCGHELIHVNSSAGVISTSARDPRLAQHIAATYRIHAKQS